MKRAYRIMLKALVIYPNDRTKELGDLLAIARAEAQRREHTHENIEVKTIMFVPECAVYVAVYEDGCSKRADAGFGKVS